jgi:hypothetical protein
LFNLFLTLNNRLIKLLELISTCMRSILKCLQELTTHGFQFIIDVHLPNGNFPVVNCTVQLDVSLNLVKQSSIVQ